MSELRQTVVILAGPNGAGKSTAAPDLLQDALAVNEFVNADVIAHGLSAFDPESAAIAAGRVMLAHIRELARQRASFAFETTLARDHLRHGCGVFARRDTPFISSSSGYRRRIWPRNALPNGLPRVDTAFRRRQFSGAIERASATSSACISRS